MVKKLSIIKYALVAGVLAVAVCPKASADTFKAQQPSKADALRLIKMAESQVTDDGSTVVEVLRYAEKMRPGIFKLSGPFDFGYKYDGTLSSVGVCYWIGAKRNKGDEYCDLSWDISSDKKNITATKSDINAGGSEEITSISLQAGRDAFLDNIDAFYQITCINPTTGKKYC